MAAERPAALLVPRVWGALCLRPGVFREVAEDQSAGIQAAILVVVTGVLEATVSAAVHEDASLPTFEVVYAVLAALIGWMVWSGILYLIATGILEQARDFRAIQRAVALAHSPGLLYGLAAIPGAEVAAGTLFFVSLLWFAAALVAIARGVLDVPLPKAAGITAFAMLLHEVLHQALRTLALVG